jgi:hypothetical protein
MQKLMLFVFLIYGFAVSAEPNTTKDLYIASYIKSMTPLLRKNVMDRMPDLSLKDLNLIVTNTTEQMADCSYYSIADYPERYRNLSISTISEGVNVFESAAQVEALMQSDIEAGTIALEKVVSLLEDASEKVTLCMEGL